MVALAFSVYHLSFSILFFGFIRHGAHLTTQSVVIFLFTGAALLCIIRLNTLIHTLHPHDHFSFLILTSTFPTIAFTHSIPLFYTPYHNQNHASVRIPPHSGSPSLNSLPCIEQNPLVRHTRLAHTLISVPTFQALGTHETLSLVPNAGVEA